MIKRIAIFSLSLILLLSLTACSNPLDRFSRAQPAAFDVTTCAAEDGSGHKLLQTESGSAGKCVYDNPTPAATPTTTVVVPPTRTNTPTAVPPTPTTVPPTAPVPPTATPTKAAPAANSSTVNPCAGDKISTVNEVEGAGPQRREIGGGEVQLVDHYPDRGILPITFVFSEMRHWLWWGFGSSWGYHGACSPPTTVIEQALAYTTARGEWHTGVTLDLTGGTVKMVGNDKKLSDDVINSWLSIYGLRLNGPVSDGKSQDKPPATLPANLPKTPISGANGGGTANCTAVETKYAPTKGQDWVIPAQTQPAFALIWSNEVSPNWVDHKIWVGNTPVAVVSGGGSLYVFPVGCDEAAKTQYANHSFKEPTPAESAKYIR